MFIRLATARNNLNAKLFLCKSLGTVKLLLKLCSFVVSASVDLLIFRFHSKMFYNIKIRIQKVVVVGGVPFDDNSCCTKWSHFSATRLIQIGRIRCIQLSNFIRCSSGSGCGPVGRTEAFTMRNSRFESSHQHILVTVNIVEKTKKRKEVDYYTMLSAYSEDVQWLSDGQMSLWSWVPFCPPTTQVLLFVISIFAQETKECWWWPPQLRGFICAYHPAAPGSIPKHSIYTFFNLYRENNENKLKEAGIGPFKKRMFVESLKHIDMSQ